MVELLDDPTMRAQLLALERRAVRGGRDSIDHPRGGHDDVANAAGGAVVSVLGVGGKKKRPLVFSGSYPSTQRDAHAEMRELIARTKAEAEADARRDAEMARAAENEPMRSPAVWWVHQ